MELFLSLYLVLPVATRKLKVGKSQDDSTSWLNRNRRLLKVTGPLLVVFGF